MAKILKPKLAHHALKIQGDYTKNRGLLLYMEGTKLRLCIYDTTDGGIGLVDFTGHKPLRALAKAILKEVGDK